ncbi:uncharacterized protein LOC117295782 [Asterias rubens]|uniref:uncharacterized protein LOC117295782 n=1 Tax=Asterias rubens TaxID=7604 RepID=UPI0014554F11|nr:uncharacterized protein LOC117295782 [Asterias rubens]XP_033634426.1 uncharacterized protein LOC117295782 [Asterias rubens]XP_033634427.1 uncharacterized protein LOC117295782 [Asterias rubens]
MSTTSVFDVCVVGAGLWGSGAAKYCSERDGISVCLVGPSEPKTQQDRLSSRVFGAHHDEERIYRTSDPIFEWGELARRSVEKYRDIELTTGLSFHEEVGCMFVTVKGSNYHNRTSEFAKNNVHTKDISHAEALHRIELLSLDMLTSKHGEEGVVTLLQETEAGHMNPRKLLAAQLQIARSRGCEVVNDVVNHVIDHEDEDIIEIVTDSNRVIKARRVLLCTGAYTAVGGLLPRGQVLDLKLTKQQVVFIEVSEKDRKKLSGMPVIILHEDRDYGRDGYILPPIQYTNGKYYLKIGHHTVGEEELSSNEELVAWFRSQGTSETEIRLSRNIRQLFPELVPLSTHSETCVTVTTPTRKLYCDMVTPRLGVLVGGNGWGAKSSDEIGRMGAGMILSGSWDHDMPQDVFKAMWKKS